MNKKKLKFSFILCAIFFAFFYFNPANATEQILYTSDAYDNHYQFTNATTQGYGQVFKSDNTYCNLSKVKQYFKSTGNINCNILWTLVNEPYRASSTVIATGTQAVSLTTVIAEKTFTPTTPISLEKNKFYTFIFSTTDCAQVSAGFGNTIYTKDYAAAGTITSDDKKPNVVTFGYVPRGTIYYDDTITCEDDCPDCPECETCTGSSTLVHFDFDNATTTDISRIVATSKTYTDDTGTPTSIMVSTFDIPVILFYYIFMIMIMLAITIFLYFKIKKHGKD